MDPLNIGIVGAGVIGDAHASEMKDANGHRLVAVAEKIDHVRESFCARYNIKRSYANWDNLVNDSEIDVVYICVPNNLHMPIAIASMQSGKHVVCEKPIACDISEAKSIEKSMRETGKKFFIALNHRFNPANQFVKQIIGMNEIGKPFLAISTFIGNEFGRMNDPDNWKGSKSKSGGGVVIDNGTHMIDLLQWWFGKAISVMSLLGRLAISADNKQEDTAILNIEFANGVIAELSLTFGARYSPWPVGYCGAAIRTEIFGLDGALKVGNDDPLLRLINRNSQLKDISVLNINTGMPNSIYAHFADCINYNTDPIVTIYDAISALEVVEASYKSNKTGERVII